MEQQRQIPRKYTCEKLDLIADLGRWGQANYFAEDAKFADSYAYVPSEGLKQLIVAKVLIGNCYFSIPDNTLRLPPILSTNTVIGNLLFSEFRYDTITEKDPVSI